MPKRAPHPRLTPQDVKMIATAISDMPYRVRPTWDHVRSAALSVTKATYSRQALSAHPLIFKAYEDKVLEYQRFREHGQPPKLVSHDEEPWQRRIRELEADKAELQAKVVELDKRIMLHIANAVRLGIPTRHLEAPTEKPFKRATDVTTGKRVSLRSTN